MLVLVEALADDSYGRHLTLYRSDVTGKYYIIPKFPWSEYCKPWDACGRRKDYIRPHTSPIPLPTYNFDAMIQERWSDC